MAYRKMWKLVTIYLIYYTVIGTILSEQNRVFSSVNFVVSLVLGLYGNSLYFSYASKKIDAIKAKGLPKDKEIPFLQQAGGTSTVGLIAVLFISLALGIMMVFIEQSWR